MSSIVTVSSDDGGYTVTLFALTTKWPFTPGCDKQFVIFTDDSTTSVTAYDPALGGAWNTAGSPQWFPQTRCLPEFLTDGNTVALASMVCPESWTMVDSSYNTNTATGDLGGYMSCCPPSYTLTGTQTLGPSFTVSGCQSQITAGQVLSGVDAIYRPMEYSSSLIPLVTVTFSTATQVNGYMLTASYFSAVSRAMPTYTSGPTYYNDDGDNGFGLRLAARLAIGITIPLVFLIVSAIITFIILHRRRKRRRLQMNGPGNGQGYVPSQYANGPQNGGPGQYPSGGQYQYAQPGVTQFGQGTGRSLANNPNEEMLKQDHIQQPPMQESPSQPVGAQREIVQAEKTPFPVATSTANEPHPAATEVAKPTGTITDNGFRDEW